MGMYLALIWKRSTAKRRRKVRRRRKGDDMVAPEIPLDLQIEILTRLPAKSLMRFKCVSKLWSCLIHSRYVSNRYLTVARPPRVYISVLEHVHCDSMEVCHNPGKSVLLSLSSSNSGESLNPDFTMPGMGGHNMVVLRGLILYIVCRKACIYNPATRQSVTLPAVKSNIFAQQESRKYVFNFLGHDPVLDQYKVFCNVVVVSSKTYKRIASEHWVFVLEGGGSWKKIEFDQPHHFPTSLGLCTNGVIYYLAPTYTVFSFDVRFEEFNMIQTPHEVFNMIQRPHEVSDFGEYVGFIEYGGKPTIFDHTHLIQNGLVNLWVLEDGGKWSKKSLVLQPCQMHLVDGINHLAVECTTQNGEIILIPRPLPSSSYFLYYDVQKNHLRKVNVSGIWDHDWFGKIYIYFKHMDKSESIMHLET